VDGFMDTLRVYENLSTEVRLFRDFVQEDHWF
jgi:hypothetical protein